MKLTNIFLIGSLSLAGTSAFADSGSEGTGLFLEPGVAYQVTNSNVDYPGGGNSSASTSGFSILLRGGVHVWDRFFVAADARYGLLNFNDNASNLDVRASSWDVGPVIGLQMPEDGPRMYVGYVLGGSVDPQESGGRNVQFDQATGWRFGAGLKVKSVSVNIEWQHLHYGNSKYTTPTSSTGGVRYNPDGLVASVTFPIEFR